MQTKVIQPFFMNPMKQFGVRELSRVTHTDTKTVLKYLKEFVRKKIIVKHQEKGKYSNYEANRKSYLYRHEKSEFLIKKIIESGLIEYLEKKTNSKAIVLFGSVQKGTYHKESDIDIFVQGKYQRLNLSKFEKQIGYPIQLLFESKMKDLNAGLLTNLYNGLTLSGKLEVLV
jgi:predicted nucleotidyltransferase